MPLRQTEQHSTISAKDTDGLYGLHRMLIADSTHASAAAVLVSLQINLDHVARNSEYLLHLGLGHLVVQLSQVTHDRNINSVCLKTMTIDTDSM